MAAMAIRDREDTAERLLRASAEHSFDPFVEIDWDAPLEDGRLFFPEHRVSLYRTELWDRMSPEQQVELSKHEVASMASVGVWFELILMQMLVRHAYDRDPTSRHVQYALTEIADECRHSVMFGRLIEKLDCPAYGPGRRAHELGRVLKATSLGVESFAAILIAEEILDTMQREAMTDDTIQPIVRNVCRIHVIEEARHVRYARSELVRQWEEAPRAQREVSRFMVARAAQVISSRLVHPRAYEAAGLDPDEARRAAARSPERRETLRWASAKLVGFFRELGLIGGPSELLWRRSGLL